MVAESMISGIVELVTDRSIVRIQEKGQVTLPAAARRRLGLKKGDLVAVEQTAEGMLIKPLRVSDGSKGSAWLKELYDLYAPVRREAESMTEDEINAVIDEAVAAVRRKNA